MKYVFFVLTLFVLSSCATYSQKKKLGKLVIDENLENDFFTNPPILAKEGSTQIYIDSVLVDSNSLELYDDIQINAHIRDVNRLHYTFDFCNSFFSGDTLVVEFKAISKILINKIKLKILGDNFFAYYIEGEEKNEFLATPKYLIFRKKIDKPGQEIFGEMEIEFLHPETKRKSLFKGPFMCMVE